MNLVSADYDGHWAPGIHHNDKDGGESAAFVEGSERYAADSEAQQKLIADIDRRLAEREQKLVADVIRAHAIRTGVSDESIASVVTGSRDGGGGGEAAASSAPNNKSSGGGTTAAAEARTPLVVTVRPIHARRYREGSNT